MPYNKKRILTVVYWFISIIIEAFIFVIIINIIDTYVFMYKEEYLYIIMALVSSILFGLTHFNGDYLPVIVTMAGGLLSAYCYEKTKSLYACILLHSLNNFMTGVMCRLLDGRAYVMLILICMLAGVIMLIAEGIRKLMFPPKKNLLEVIYENFI